MATEEIQFLDDELQAIYTEIRKGIEQLSVMQGAADKKLEKHSHLTQRVTRARTAYQSFKVELRELRDEEKKIWTPVSAYLIHRRLDAFSTNTFSLTFSVAEREGAQPDYYKAGFGCQNGKIQLGAQGFDGRKRKFVSPKFVPRFTFLCFNFAMSF